MIKQVGKGCLLLFPGGDIPAKALRSPAVSQASHQFDHTAHPHTLHNPLLTFLLLLLFYFFIFILAKRTLKETLTLETYHSLLSF